MSDTDGQGPTPEAPPPVTRRRRKGRWWRWPATALILLVEGSLIAVALGGSALAWRTAQGPVDLSWLLPKIGRVIAVAAPALDIGIGNLAIAWEGFTKGPDQPVRLTAESLHLNDAAAGRRVTIDRMAVDLSAAWAVRGVVTPRMVTIENPRVTVRETVPTATAEARPVIERQRMTVPDVIRVLARPPSTDQDLVRVKPEALSQLRRLVVTGGEVTVQPAPDAKGAVGPALKAGAVTIDLTRAASGGLTGNFAMSLTALMAQASPTPQAPPATLGGTIAIASDATLRVRAQASLSDPARLMAAAGVSADQPVPMLPLTADADISVTPEFVPTAVSATLKGGTGQILFNGAHIPVASAIVTLTGNASHFEIDPKSRIAFGAVSTQPPPTFSFGGDIHRTAAGYAAGVSLKIDHVASDDLKFYWPPHIAEGGREWIDAQIKDGSAHDGALQFGLTADQNLDNLNLVSASGQVLADGLTVTWLPPLPPMTNVAGAITLAGTDQIKITVSRGQQGNLAVSNGSLVISQLSAAIQPAALSVDVAGPLIDGVALLNSRRLHLLQSVPVPLNVAAGRFKTTVKIGLPLKNIVLASDVTAGVHATLTGVQLTKFLAGMELTAGNFSLDATTSKLHLAGQANLAAIPTQATLDADFTAGPPSQVQVRVNATATADPATLSKAGIPTGGVLQGTAQLGVAVAARRDGRTDINATATLPLANLSVAAIGWRGGAGTADATAHVALQGQQIIAIDTIGLTGAGATLVARSTVRQGRVSAFAIDRLVLGRTDLHGTVGFPATPADPYVLDVEGRALDLSTPFKGPKPTATSVAGTNQALSTISSKQEFQRHTPWRATIKLDRIIFGTTPRGTSRELDRVSGQAADNGIIVTNADVTVTVPPSGKASRLTILPAGNNTRRVTLVDDDFGGMLRATNAYDAITGGDLRINAVYDDKQPDHPLAGTAEMDEFELGDAPTAARMLQLMTLYGVADLLHGPGLHFKRMVAPFRLADERLDLLQARAYSESLGLTARGSIDLPRNDFDIHGTIIPAYFFNSLLGHIPLIGKLFSPETGGGVFAADFTLTGPIDSPQVHVNPLSLVTPGFLRGLFGKDVPRKTGQ